MLEKKETDKDYLDSLIDKRNINEEMEENNNNNVDTLGSEDGKREGERDREEVKNIEDESQREEIREREEEEHSRSSAAYSSDTKKFSRTFVEDELKAAALWATMLRETGTYREMICTVSLSSSL